MYLSAVVELHHCFCTLRLANPQTMHNDLFKKIESAMFTLKMWSDPGRFHKNYRCTCHGEEQTAWIYTKHEPHINQRLSYLMCDVGICEITRLCVGQALGFARAPWGVQQEQVVLTIHLQWLYFSGLTLQSLKQKTNKLFPFSYLYQIGSYTHHLQDNGYIVRTLNTSSEIKLICGLS